jgi:hypothetical protein
MASLLHVCEQSLLFCAPTCIDGAAARVRESLELGKVQAVEGDPRGSRSVKTVVACPRICVLIHLDILLKSHTDHAC